MKKTTIKMLILSILITSNFMVFSEGSADLYPLKTVGKRASLMSKSMNSIQLYDLFPTPGTMKVYVKANEVLYVGSSSQGKGSFGTINLRAPNGNSYTTGTGTKGLIKSRIEELNGPNRGAKNDGYMPYSRKIQIDEEGVWEIDFVGPTDPTAASITAYDIDANASWIQPVSGNAAIVVAWDVSVGSEIDSTNLIKGRLYCNILNLNIAQNTGTSYAWNSILYVLTDVGYVYKVNSNGQNGGGFNFFSNNKGIQDTTINASGSQNQNSMVTKTWIGGEPWYKSIPYKNLNQQTCVYDPRLPDNETKDITYKIFFNLPDTINLPDSANISFYPENKIRHTWLKKAVKVIPAISNLLINTAQDSGLNESSARSSFITFNSNINGRYNIVLAFPTQAGTKTRILTGDCILGFNKVYWDGKDGSTIPVDINDGEKIALTGKISVGEVHFPFNDMENNPNGLIIELLKSNLSSSQPLKDSVYWDDTGLVQVNSLPNPVQNLIGISSSKNGHKWGSYSDSQTFIKGSAFGNTKIIDTWAYAGESQSSLSTAWLLPNLHVSELSCTDVLPGKDIIISWTVKNDGNISTKKSKWSDRIWLIKDITKTFDSNGIVLYESQNKDSLGVGKSYTNTVKLNLPDNFSGYNYIVVTTNLNNILSINWNSVNDTIPNPYNPSITGFPYPYLRANTDIISNNLIEEGDNNTSDNFNYLKIYFKQPDLQVITIKLPLQLVADRKATISAIIANKGEYDILDKTWTDRIYISKDINFNKSNANLLATTVHSFDLRKDSLYETFFNLILPSDTISLYRFFVETDGLDSVFESNQTNNVTSSDWINILPNTINDKEYNILKEFFTTYSGEKWQSKWIISSNRICNDNWHGINFEDGSITSISLPSNNIKGNFPILLFTLPKLKLLNLYDNQITEKYDSIYASSIITTDSLREINFGKNLLSGEIPPLLYHFKNLKNLNLEKNMIGSLKRALPLHITNLNIQNQNLKINPITMSGNPQIEIPNICKYNHELQTFDWFEFKYFNYDWNMVIKFTNYVNNQINMEWYTPTDAYVWKYKSGEEITFTQTKQSSIGTTVSTSFTFQNGDANIDQYVNVLDVQHELNYIMGNKPIPFNYYASDLFRDNLITVQDIVSTINLILSTDSIQTTSQSSGIQKVKGVTENTLELKNGKLLLNLSTPVSAMDISINGTIANQIRFLLKSSDFQIKAVNKNGYTRFILFSPTGAVIPTGETNIAEIQSITPTIQSYLLADKDANIVPAMIKSVTTDLNRMPYTENSITFNNDQFELTIFENTTNVSLSIYNMQGMFLRFYDLGSLQAGNYIHTYTEGLSTGVYILKLTINTDRGISIKNIKFTIAK